MNFMINHNGFLRVVLNLLIHNLIIIKLGFFYKLPLSNLGRISNHIG